MSLCRLIGGKGRKYTISLGFFKFWKLFKENLLSAMSAFKNPHESSNLSWKPMIQTYLLILLLKKLRPRQGKENFQNH